MSQWHGPPAWVMSNPVTIIIALLGVIYLIASMVANQYKREGLRLWLYRSSWGKSPEWTHSDEDHKKELRTLMEISLRPSLAARASTLPYYGRGPRIYTGFWLQLLLPSKLEGTAVKLQPAMVDSGWFSDSLMQGMADKFYDQFLEGHWAPIEQFGQPPAQRPNGPLPGDTLYPEGTQHRLWQTWIAYQRPRAGAESSLPGADSGKRQRPGLHVSRGYRHLVLRGRSEKRCVQQGTQ